MFERVSIITINFNETEVTCALLDSIRRQDYPDLELIVVDNASRENPAPIFESRYPEVKFIRSEQNLGFAGGNNLALPVASGKYLFFVNNDAELEPGCIRTLVQFLENQVNVGMVSPLICYFPENPQQALMVQYAGMSPVSPFTGRNRTFGERAPDRGQFSSAAPTAYAHGAAMMVPKVVLEKVGPMWEGFFLYYEELDWAERIKRAGFEVWVAPQARVLHKESLTIDKMGTTKTYYLTRNRILFMRRNFGSWQIGVFYLFLVLVTLPKNSLMYVLKGDFDNLRAFWKGIFSNFGTRIDALTLP